MKQLLKAIQQEENCNKYYYDKMISDFEMENRYNSIMRAMKNKWRSESMKYMERLHNMKEKNEENYSKRINKLQKSLNNKDDKINKKQKENQLMKDEERKHSHDLFSKKEQKDRDTYNRKLQMDEDERTENERKLINRS